MPGGARRVFISHTSEMGTFPHDRSFLAVTERAVMRAQDLIVEMDLFSARDIAPLEYCNLMIEECDIYVALIGFRYGSCPPAQPSKSYVELEFEAASEASIPRLIFMLYEEAEVPVGTFVQANDGGRQQRFRKRLQDSHIILTSFRTAADLEASVFFAL